MRNLAFVIVLANLIGFLGCSSQSESPLEPLPTALDVFYYNKVLGFKIKPPLDWVKKEKNGDIVFIPPSAEIETRQAKAKIIIRHLADFTADYTPDEFRKLVLQGFKESKNINNINVLAFGGAPGTAFCEVVVERSTEKNDCIYYFKYLQHKNGCFQICASALKEWWQRVKPLLLASVKTFNITARK